MAGFANDIVYANNGDFSIAGSAKGSATNGLQTNGQMWIGTTALNLGGTHISVGTITSPDSSITVGYASPNITIVANSSGGLVHTLTGNSGVATASAGNINVITANTTVKFVGASSTLTQDFGLSNLFLGSSATAITTATNNSFLGNSAGNAITTSGLNVGVGTGALQTLTTKGAGNGENVALGYSALSSLGTGINNIGIGSSAGANYTTSESSNILISSAGTAAESNTIRIGTAGSSSGHQNRAFVAGITGVTVSGSAPVGVDTNGQLSSLGFGTSGQVLTSTGASSSPTWQSGFVVQQVRSSTTSALTGTTTFAPGTLANTGGTEILTVTITPKNANNILKIEFNFYGEQALNVFYTIGAIFQDSTTNALYATGGGIANNGYLQNVPGLFYMTAGTTSATTFKLRVGAYGTGGNWNVNATQFGASLFNAANFASLIVTEMTS